MKKICVIDDSVEFQMLIKRMLSHWYELSPATDLNAAREVISQKKFDLILLDVQLPDGNGFEFCNELKSKPETKNIPIIFLTALNSPLDKMTAFTLGADDFITKPLEPIEARARIDARLRKSSSTVDSTPSEFQTIGHYEFDLIKQRAYLVENGSSKDLQLTPLEFKLLHFLALREGQVFNRVELMKRIIDPTVHVSAENIYAHVCSVRRKLGAHRKQVECIPRVGYRFTLTEETETSKREPK